MEKKTNTPTPPQDLPAHITNELILRNLAFWLSAAMQRAAVIDYDLMQNPPEIPDVSLPGEDQKS